MWLIDGLHGMDVIGKVHKKVLLEKAQKLQSGQPLTTCFFVSQKQFWSMQSLYDALAKNECCHLYTVPFPVSYHIPEERKKNYDELCAFHEKKGASVVQVCDHNNNLLVEPEVLAPDIIFYEQHWMGNFHSSYSIMKMWEKALCICMPYGVMIANIPESQFNGVAHNLAWRNFVETPVHFGLSRKYAQNKGVNTVVSGYPKFDAYALPPTKNYWKTQSPSIKRVIWAPHYSINTGGEIEFATFLQYWLKLMDLVKSNAYRIEVVLKPHPALKSQCLRIGVPEKLYDRYMANWDALPNASVVTDGDYIDLFATSDAIILDSLSFISEYMITGKPMCFLSKFQSFDELSTHFNDFGKKAISLIDIAYSLQDIYDFFTNVCNGKAQVSEERRYFTDEVLKVNFGHAGKFIADHIMEQLKIV